MEFTTILAIALGVTGVVMAIVLQVIMRLEQSKAKSEELSVRTDAIAKETSIVVKALADRLQQLETGLGGEALALERAQYLDKRLADIEETLEPFKNRSREVTSMEYQFLMFEIDRLVRDLKEDLRQQHEDLIHRQRTHEVDLDRRLGTFRTIFLVSLTVVGIIIAGLGLIIYLIGSL